MSKNPVLQFEGDLRLSIRAENGDLTPILADAADPQGNTPVEASGLVFGYEAGDEVSVVSKRRERYGNKIFSDQQPGDSNISLTLLACPPAIVARIFYGDAANTTVTGAVVVGEEITFAAGAGATQQLAHNYLASSPAAVVTNGESGGSLVTYTAGVDYRIEPRSGRITRLSGGIIGATGQVTVGYTYRSYTLTTIVGGSKPLESFYITGDMLNRPDKSDLALEIFHAKLAVDGDVDLLSDDPITVTLTGSLLTPADKPGPYIARRVDLAA